jgi:type II secretory pathway pseudopilin PulG
MKDKEPCRKDLGFTLIELMFAAGVLATGLGLLFGALVSINLMGQVSEGKTRAAAYMSAVMENVRQSSRVNLFYYATLPPPQEPGWTMAVTLEATNASGTAVRLPLADPTTASTLPSPLAVRATVVCATPRGNMFSMTSITYNGV